MILAYTAIYGGKDRYVKPEGPGISKTLFFGEEAEGPSLEETPRRRARRKKILSHELKTDLPYTVWLDGSIVLQGANLLSMCEEFLKDAPLAIFAHDARNCIYAEAEICSKYLVDDPEVISKQMSRYLDMGYPKEAGLVLSGVLLRRHGDPYLRVLEKLWWYEIENGSVRDQLSFNYAAWISGVPFKIIPGKMSDWGIHVRPHSNLII